MSGSRKRFRASEETKFIQRSYGQIFFHAVPAAEAVCLLKIKMAHLERNSASTCCRKIYLIIFQSYCVDYVFERAAVIADIIHLMLSDMEKEVSLL